MEVSYIFALWGRPKAKPWDFVRGRRFRCCGHLTTQNHSLICRVKARYAASHQGETIHIPKFAPLSLRGD